MKRKCDVTSADYLGLSHVLEVLLIEGLSIDIVGLKVDSITLPECLMHCFYGFVLRYFTLL